MAARYGSGRARRVRERGLAEVVPEVAEVVAGGSWGAEGLGGRRDRGGSGGEEGGGAGMGEETREVVLWLCALT